MARWIRLWEKKRGLRRTGSPLMGGLGEALFFGILFLLGSVSLAYLITRQVLQLETADLALGAGFWLLLLVLASFVLIGGGGLARAILQVGASAERRSALAKRAADLELISEALPSDRDYPAIPRDANLTNSPGVRLAFRLPVMQSQAWSLLAATLFCVVWNSILAVLATIALNSHRTEAPDWFLTILVLPFLVIGGWAVYFFVLQLLLHTGIGPTQLEISDHPLRPGESYRLFLSQHGRMQLESLELSLVCDESATYLQGTDIRTETCRVFRESLFARRGFRIERGEPLEHECTLPIPAETMHSFQSRYNAVLWKLEVRGEVKSWPAFCRVFPIVVFPPRPADSGEDSLQDDGEAA